MIIKLRNAVVIDDGSDNALGPAFLCVEYVWWIKKDRFQGSCVVTVAPSTVHLVDNEYVALEEKEFLNCEHRLRRDTGYSTLSIVKVEEDENGHDVSEDEAK